MPRRSVLVLHFATLRRFYDRPSRITIAGGLMRMFVP
jgi:hypothetical protein